MQDFKFTQSFYELFIFTFNSRINMKCTLSKEGIRGHKVDERIKLMKFITKTSASSNRLKETYVTSGSDGKTLKSASVILQAYSVVLWSVSI